MKHNMFYEVIASMKTFAEVIPGRQNSYFVLHRDLEGCWAEGQ